MADIGFIRSQLGGIKDEDTKRVLTTIFEHVLGNFRFGVPEHQTRAENAQLYFEESTTGASTSEFSFTHGLETAPKLAIPCIDLNQPGSQTVNLEVTKVADTKRIYLKSTSTGARVMLLVE
jgi:hypothetical protein